MNQLTDGKAEDISRRIIRRLLWARYVPDPTLENFNRVRNAAKWVILHDAQVDMDAEFIRDLVFEVAVDENMVAPH